MARKPALTEDHKARIEILVADEVPTRWIADTIGVSHDMVRVYLRNRPDAMRNGKMFNEVWTSIRPNETLLKWHNMFAPPSQTI